MELTYQERKRLNEVIDITKKEIELKNMYTKVFGFPQPGTLMDDMFDELANRSSMLFTAWIPNLARVREAHGSYCYTSADTLIYYRARQELGLPHIPGALTEKDATRDEFIEALLEWAERNKL